MKARERATPIAAAASGSDAAACGKMDAEEYLDRCGVTVYMKDMMTLLLENRPDKPIEFMAEYFRTVIQGNSPLLRAYRYVRLARPGQEAFADNLVAAYGALDARRGAVLASDLHRLLRLISNDYPVNISRSILLLLDKRESDSVTYVEFSIAVRACLQYDEFFQRAEALLSTSLLESPGVTTGLPSRRLLDLMQEQIANGPPSPHSALARPASPPTHPMAAHPDGEAQRAAVQQELSRRAPTNGAPPPEAVTPREYYLALLRASISHDPAVDEAVAAATVRTERTSASVPPA